MTWALTAKGPWSKPVLVMMSRPQMDTNMAVVIRNNSSLVGMWRDHHPGGHYSTPHLVTASDWKDPATYKTENGDLLGAPGGQEDMFMWVDARGNYHTIFHQMYGCPASQLHAEDDAVRPIQDTAARRRRPTPSPPKPKGGDNCVSHAFSADGHKWTLTGIAATSDTHYTDGTSTTFPYLERPKLMFDESGTKPVALTNGVKPGWGVMADQSFTLLRPLKQ